MFAFGGKAVPPCGMSIVAPSGIRWKVSADYADRRLCARPRGRRVAAAGYSRTTPTPARSVGSPSLSRKIEMAPISIRHYHRLVQEAHQSGPYTPIMGPNGRKLLFRPSTGE